MLKVRHRTFRWSFVLTFATSRGGFSGLSGMVGEDLDQQFVAAFLELVNDGVVQRILVLLKPSGDVVRHLPGQNNIVARK